MMVMTMQRYVDCVVSLGTWFEIGRVIGLVSHGYVNINLSKHGRVVEVYFS